jgi:hypothetical protein
MKRVRKWLRVLAAVTACLALVYPLVEAMDTTGVTDSETEFQALTYLLIVGILIALLRLILRALKRLIWGPVRVRCRPVSIRRCRLEFSMARPLGRAPPLLSLRI